MRASPPPSCCLLYSLSSPTPSHSDLFAIRTSSVSQIRDKKSCIYFHLEKRARRPRRYRTIHTHLMTLELFAIWASNCYNWMRCILSEPTIKQQIIMKYCWVQNRNRRKPFCYTGTSVFLALWDLRSQSDSGKKQLEMENNTELSEVKERKKERERPWSFFADFFSPTPRVSSHRHQE